MQLQSPKVTLFHNSTSIVIGQAGDTKISLYLLVPNQLRAHWLWPVWVDQINIVDSLTLSKVTGDGMDWGKTIYPKSSLFFAI